MKQRWGVIGLVAVLSFLSGGWLLLASRGYGGLDNNGTINTLDYGRFKLGAMCTGGCRVACVT